MKVIILTAGRGSRLAPLTNSTPKTLIKINKKERIIDKIIQNIPAEITEVIFVINYLGEKIKKYIRENYKQNTHFKISFVWQKEKSGTMGALLSTKYKIINEEKFLVMNGDEIHQKKFIKKILKENWAMGFVCQKFPANYWTFDFNQNNFVTNFRPQTKKEQLTGAWNFSGMAVLDPKIFSFEMKVFKEKEIGLPQTILKERENFPIKAIFEKNWISINSLADLEKIFDD